MPGGRVLAVYMTGEGGSNGASYWEPKKIHETDILHSKKYLASKFPSPQNTRLTSGPKKKYVGPLRHASYELLPPLLGSHVADVKPGKTSARK